MNKKLLTILLSVLLPAFLVSAVVYATTSVGDAVSVGTTLTVTGATTLNGNVTLGNEATDTVTIDGPVTLGGTTAKGITLSGTYSSSAIYIGGSGILAAGEQAIYVNCATETVATNAAWLTLKSDVVTGDVTGLRSKVTSNAASGGDAASGQNVRGAYSEAICGASMHAGLLQGVLATASAAAGSCRAYNVHVLGAHYSSGASTVIDGDLYVGYFRAQTRSTNARNVTGHDVLLALENEGIEGTGAKMESAIRIFATNVTTPKAFDYGIDMSGAAGEIDTADIRLSNGETISNVTNGTIALGAATTTFDGDVTVGVDGTGHDVIFYGDTTGKYLTYDADAYTLHIRGAAKFHNKQLTTNVFAVEIKADTKNATGVYTGALQVTVREYPTDDTSAVTVNGSDFTTYLHADDTKTDGYLTSIVAKVENQGTFNGAAIIMTPIYSLIGATGTFTSVNHVCGLWLDSHLDSTITSGSFEMLYMTNNGDTQMDAAIFLTRSKVTNFVTFSGSGAMIDATAVTAETSTGRIKIEVDGATRYLYFYD